MTAYLTRRLALLVPVFFGVTLLSFTAVELIPVDKAEFLGGKYHDQATIDRIRRDFGWDQPLYVQYFRMIERAALHLDFGMNPTTGRPVRDELFEGFAATFELSLLALLIAIVLGIRIGVAAARRPGSWRDLGAMGVALSGVSVPIFWLAMLLVAAFSVGLGWFPVSGRLSATYLEDLQVYTNFLLIDTVLNRNFGAFVSALHHIILPAVCLATIPLALIVRMTRSTLMETLSQEYVRTARAKGLDEAYVVRRHALKPAMIPIATTTGMQLGYLLGGAVLTETVFQWPGLGTYIVDAVKVKNVFSIQGGVILMAAVVVFVNLVVDVLYARLDPRIRFTAAHAD